MTVRPIDASRCGEILEQWKKDCLQDNDTQSADIISDVILELDDMPTLTPPNEGAKGKNVPANEPLTLEELREMDEPTPVWWERAGLWCLCERGFIITPNGNIYEFEENNWTFYRRPPDGEEEN